MRWCRCTCIRQPDNPIKLDELVTINNLPCVVCFTAAVPAPCLHLSGKRKSPAPFRLYHYGDAADIFIRP